MSYPGGFIREGAEFVEGSASEVWKGLIQLPNRGAPRPAYFKMDGLRGFWTETACHRLAEAAGLPVAEGFWGQLRRSDLPDSRRWLDGESERVVFAAAAGRGPSLGKLGEVMPAKTLRKLPEFPLICVFDELIANGDRHEDNILDNARGGIILIDFGHAFGGPEHPLEDTAPRFNNQLLEGAFALMDARERQRFKLELADAVKLVGEAMPAFHEVLSRSPLREPIGTFVRTRYGILRELIAERLSSDSQLQLTLPSRPEFNR